MKRMLSPVLFISGPNCLFTLGNLSKEKTYYNNPYEVRARKAGANNRLKCILDMYKLNYLK